MMQLRNFKKAISVVVLFGFVFIFNACGKNVTLERGNLVDAAVMASPTTTREMDSQVNYTSEYGQLQTLDAFKDIPVANLTELKPEEKQKQTYLKDTQLQTRDSDSPTWFGASVPSFNPKGFLNPNPYALSFTGHTKEEPKNKADNDNSSQLKEERLKLNSFDKGLVSNVAANVIPDDAFSAVMNIDFSDKKALKSIEGSQIYGILNNNNTPIEKGIQGGAVYNYEQSNSAIGERMVVACDGFLWYLALSDNSPRTFTKYKTADGTDVTINPYIPVEFAQCDNKLFFVNGNENVVDGISNSYIGYIEGDEVKAVTSSSNDPTINKLRSAKYISVMGDRLFVASTNPEPNGVYWYNPRTYDRWNYDVIGKEDGEYITGIAPLNGHMYVFKKHNVYRLSNQNTCGSNRVNTNYGAISNRTIKQLKDNLIYLSPDGVASLDGDKAKLIDENVRNSIFGDNKNFYKNNSVLYSYTKTSNFDYFPKDGNLINKNIIFRDNEISYVKNIYCKFVIDRKTSLNCSISENRLANQGDRYNLSSHVENGERGTFTIPDNNKYYTLLYFKISQKVIDYKMSYIAFKFDVTTAIYEDWKDKCKGFLGLYCPYTKVGTHEDLYKEYFRIEVTIWDDSNYRVANKVEISADDILAGRKDVNLEPNDNFKYDDDIEYKLMAKVVHGDKKYGSVQFRMYLSNDSSNVFNKVAFGRDKNKHINMWSYVRTYCNINEFYYITKEYDTEAKHGCALETINFKFNYMSYFKLEVAMTDESYANSNFDDIPQQNVYSKEIDGRILDKTKILKVEADSLENTNGTRLTEANCKRYINIRIRSIKNDDNAFWFFDINKIELIPKSPRKYISEPIQIGDNDIIKFGTVDYIGNFVNDDSGIYIRTASSNDVLKNCDFIKVTKDDEIDEIISPNNVMQYCVLFYGQTENENVNSITISYYKNIQSSIACAGIYKDNYILNIPSSNDYINSIEYIYNKNGYWLVKDNERNSVYVNYQDKLFAGYNQNGIIREKYKGWANDDISIKGFSGKGPNAIDHKPYQSYFVTKKFALRDVDIRDVENMSKQIEVEYKSHVPITVSYSINDSPFDEPNRTFVCEQSGDMVAEIEKVLSGIQGEQTIQFKVSWEANGDTEFHNLELIRKPLKVTMEEKEKKKKENETEHRRIRIRVA